MREKARKTTPGGLIAGPPWAQAIDDLARLRALTQKGAAVIHSELSGSSMGPALPDGARIRIRSGAEDSWRLGHVIAFIAGSRVMAHRIVYEGRHGDARHFVITQGDGNWLCDPPVNRSTVVGQVEAYSIGDDWRPVADAEMAAHRQLVGWTALALMRIALEASPVFTIRVSRLMSWIRMSPRLAISKLRRSLPGHVRH